MPDAKSSFFMLVGATLEAAFFYHPAVPDASSLIKDNNICAPLVVAFPSPCAVSIADSSLNGNICTSDVHFFAVAPLRRGALCRLLSYVNCSCNLCGSMFFYLLCHVPSRKLFPELPICGIQSSSIFSKYIPLHPFLPQRQLFAFAIISLVDEI
jgi:hypothetical protein